MTRLLLLASLPVLLLAGGCADLFSFSVRENIPEQRVTGSGSAGGLADLLGDVPITVNLAEEQSARSLGPLGSASVSALSLRITDTAQSGGDVDNFDFLDSIQVFVSSSAPGSSLPRVLVAELDPIPTGLQVIDLDVTGVNIKPQIEEGSIIEAAATGTVPADDVTFDGTLTLTVDVL